MYSISITAGITTSARAPALGRRRCRRPLPGYIDLRLAPRLEWFNDADGFSTGIVQKVKEFTMTGEFKSGNALVTRIEYRRDWSDVAFFERGSGGLHKSQSTILVGLVAYFGPKK